MTTDITELAQSLKAAAERVIKNYDSEWFETGSQICTVHKSKINLISLANPANVLALVEALEKAQQRIIALQQRHEVDPRTHEIIDLKERIDNLESFRTAYMEWGDKTDWMQTDKRFDVLKPWGKHRADVLKAYIEHLESRTVTVKLSKDHVDDADLFGWGVVVVPLEALKDACANAGVTVEIADDGIKVEAE
ncbi:Ead domain protein [Klebsiella pneumoniae]|uniref:hypothetical protein n=1 Tax=Klebsiella pneumoniae TaxID=573 RepID=UPI000DE7895D|nr:hypothetical protein [Klebsiella pneumoniae]SSH66786.1 Ead domain protein [Klebsiella pneumoniae]